MDEKNKKEKDLELARLDFMTERREKERKMDR